MKISNLCVELLDRSGVSGELLPNLNLLLRLLDLFCLPILSTVCAEVRFPIASLNSLIFTVTSVAPFASSEFSVSLVSLVCLMFEADSSGRPAEPPSFPVDWSGGASVRPVD